MEQDEDFEGTEEEKLRLENELLRIKLQAELGAHFGSISGEPLPPEIEKQFLEQVMAFHQHIADHPPAALHAHLGSPEFKTSTELTSGELESAWEDLVLLLEEKQVRVDFLARYPLALKYDFIVSELFNYETELPSLEGQYVCFIYEDFHQNHEYDIRKRTEEFMEGFFEGRFPEKAGWYFADELVNDKAEPMRRDELQPLLDRFHGLFSSIKEHDYRVEAISAQPDKEVIGATPRMGFSEGTVRYTAVLTDGQEQLVTGPFKLYMQCVNDWWEIFFFQLHGFSWRRS